MMRQVTVSFVAPLHDTISVALLLLLSLPSAHWQVVHLIRHAQGVENLLTRCVTPR